MLLPNVHRGFGGELLALITGGAFMEPSTMQFFYDLGIPVINGYGLTEAGTALTLNDLKPFRADTVGKPLPGMELKILNPGEDKVGEVAVRSKTVMSHYLDDPDQTADDRRLPPGMQNRRPPGFRDTIRRLEKRVHVRFSFFEGGTEGEAVRS